MTSQRDEATRQPAGEGMTDDPIVIERRDEILTGDDPADDGPGEDLTASDELVGRHAAPDTGADPGPLVVPPDGPSPDMGVSRDPPRRRPVRRLPARPSPVRRCPARRRCPAWPRPWLGPAWPGRRTRLSPRRPASGRGPASGSPGAGLPAAALSEQQWPAIQAMFVDDPRGSVQRAAAAADEVLKALVASLEREQAALRTSWENGSDSTTEDLRTALQQYRAFCGRLEGLA